MKNVPGGPFDYERKLDAQIEANIQKKYHLDWPLWRQFAHYVGPFNLDEERALLAPGTTAHPVAQRTAAASRRRSSGGARRGLRILRYKDFTVNDILAEPADSMPSACCR